MLHIAESTCQNIFTRITAPSRLAPTFSPRPTSAFSSAQRSTFQGRAAGGLERSDSCRDANGHGRVENRSRGMGAPIPPTTKRLARPRLPAHLSCHARIPLLSPSEVPLSRHLRCTSARTPSRHSLACGLCNARRAPYLHCQNYRMLHGLPLTSALMVLGTAGHLIRGFVQSSGKKSAPIPLDSMPFNDPATP